MKPIIRTVNFLVVICLLFIFNSCKEVPDPKYAQSYNKGAADMAAKIDSILVNNYKIYQPFLDDSLPIWVNGKPDGGRQHCEGGIEALRNLREELAKDTTYARAQKYISPPTKTH